jgi:hypothetical protein
MHRGTEKLFPGLEEWFKLGLKVRMGIILVI